MDEKPQDEKIEEKEGIKVTHTDYEHSATADDKIPVEVKAEDSDLNKKIIPIVKSKVLLIGLAILIYTIIVASVTVKIDRKILVHKIQKSFQEVFNINGSNSNKIENKIVKDEKKPKKEARKLNLNETVTIGDVMELTLEGSDWVDEIKPSNTENGYSYYEDKPGEKYFVIKGKVKNIAGEDLDMDYINQSKIIVNDKYKANVEIQAEDSNGTSFYGEIKPLQTLNIIAYASLSDEAYDICKEVRCDIDIVNDSTHIKEFYSNNTPHDSFYIEFENSNTNESEE